MNVILTAFLLVVGSALSGVAHADIAKFEDSIKPIVVGKADAPVTIIEFASLGCPHCARFHQDTYPKLKKEYFDTGKAKIIFTDFPLGTPALAAAMIARCSGPERYIGFVDMFFRAQQQWSRADKPIDALKKVARFGGFSGADVDACFKQQALINHIQTTARKAGQDHEINSTPSFLVNGKKISGNLPHAEFRVIIEDALKKAK
jgi:protein-disulfide isomerase